MACTKCGHDVGHDSTDCPYSVIKLFGVKISNAPEIPKSASTGNLLHLGECSAPATADLPSTTPGMRKSASADNFLLLARHDDDGGAADGYGSDGVVRGGGLIRSSSHDFKNIKGTTWSEEEHKLFLLGLQDLGKGKWREIARNYVRTRTPVQVASHAQKFFLRHSNANTKKKRSSLFDIGLNERAAHDHAATTKDHHNSWRPPMLQAVAARNEFMESVNSPKFAPPIVESMRQNPVNWSHGISVASPPIMLDNMRQNPVHWISVVSPPSMNTVQYTPMHWNHGMTTASPANILQYATPDRSHGIPYASPQTVSTVEYKPPPHPYGLINVDELRIPISNLRLREPGDTAVELASPSSSRTLSDQALELKL